MNDLGSLATNIVDYSFSSDTGRFPVIFVSGWLETHIGELNGLTNEDFYVDSTGAIGPSGLYPVEEEIFSTLYEIDYYDRAAREALRGVVWGGSQGITDSITMVKEGDTTIQKVSKHSISKSFHDFSKEASERLGNLIHTYNLRKSAPIQVAGYDGYEELNYE